MTDEDMRYVVIVGDGMADYPVEELGWKTPLEAANTENMDFIAKEGKCGMLKTIPEALPAGSDVANMSILGYDPLEYMKGGRGPLEAAAMGIKLEDNEIAMRCNLITVEEGIIKDYSSGHISSEESKELIAFINEEFAEWGVDFYPGVSYRNLAVLKGKKMDVTKLHFNAPHDFLGKKVEDLYIKGEGLEEENARFLNSLMRESYELLKEHEINKKRVSEGKNPANMVWFWGAGERLKLPSLKEKYNLSGVVVCAVDLIKGLGIYAGLEPVSVPNVTGYLDTNFEGKADATLKALCGKDTAHDTDSVRDETNFAFVHVEAPDEAGHEGSVEKKIKAIEDVDKRVVGRILKKIDSGKFRIVIVTDHPTPITMKTHVRDPVPFAIYGTGESGDDVEEFSERSCENGAYGELTGTKLMDILTGKNLI